jgi:hypothetical protein
VDFYNLNIEKKKKKKRVLFKIIENIY